MADIVIPPWLHPQGDPVSTFLHAFQTGAQISEEQTRLAEQQRQANMEAQARSEQLQSNMLRAMTETAVDKAYKDQTLQLHHAQLEEQKKRNADLQQKAMMDVFARRAHDAAMEQRGTALEQNIDAAMKAEATARQLEASGDTEGATRERQRAAMIQGALKPPGWQFSTDESGRPVVTYGEMKTTTATASRAQQKLQKYENATEVLNRLQQGLQAGHVGVAGLAGEYLWDKGMVQLLNLMGDESVKADPNRVSSRTGLVMLRESLLREISDDPRFSNLDREEISKALPSSGAFESLSDAQQRMATVRAIMSERAKVYAQSLNQTPPLFTLSPKEIRALYEKGKITRQQALDALTRYH